MGRTTMNMHVGSLAGTPMYMAPEVITGSDTGRKGSMDIWSLGCCIVQMATGRRPWSTLENEWSVMYHVVTGHPPLPDASQLSNSGIDFLKKCFVRDPNKRPSAEELLQHPWITSYLESYSEEGQLPPPIPEEGEERDRIVPDSQWIDTVQDRSINGDDLPPIMRSIGSQQSLERPLVRSIPNSLAIDGMVRSIPNSLKIEGMTASLENGAQAQAYFKNIAAQHAKDVKWDPNVSNN